MTPDRPAQARCRTRIALIVIGAWLLWVHPVGAQEETFELSPEDTWEPTKEIDPDSEQARLLRARHGVGGGLG